MKINIQVELDFLNEDETLEESFKESIKSSITDRVVNLTIQKLTNEIKPQMDLLFKNSIEKTMEDLLNNYLEKEVVISDGYKTEKYPSALEMIRTKFSSLYDLEFKKSSNCNSDPIYKKLNERISCEVRDTLSKVNRVIEDKAKVIAKEEIEKNSLIQALKTLKES